MIKRFRIALGFALAVLAAAPAAAQNNKPITSGNYYEDRASFYSSAIGGVTLTFSQTSATKFTNITRVSCTVATAGTGQELVHAKLIVGTSLGGSETGRSYALDFSPTYTVSSTALHYYTFNPQLLFKIGPGRFPSIVLDAQNTSSVHYFSADCTIVGDLSDN